MPGPDTAVVDAGRATRRQAGPQSRFVQTLGRPQGLLLAAVLVLMAAPVISPIRDPDFWWHLRTGQLIVDRHALLGTDPYTYTVSTHAWVMHEWLTEVLFAALHAAGGIGLIVLVLSVVTYLGLLCILLRCRATGAHPYAIAMTMVLAVVTGYPIWGPRAQMETFALSCLTIWLVDRHLRRGGRTVWVLVPVMLIWSNLHSGFVIGLGFFVVMLCAEVVQQRWHPDGAATGARLRTLWRVLLGCVLIVVLNPSGPAIYLYPAQTQASPAQQQLIQEWHSPDFHDGLVVPFELMLLTLVIMLVINRRARLRDLALAVITTALALQSTRHIALFIAATAPLWCEQAAMAAPQVWCWLRALGGGLRARRPPWRPNPGRGSTPPVRRHRSRTAASRSMALLSVPLMVVVAVLVPGVRLAGAMSTPEDGVLYAQDYPVCAARWLLQAPGGLNVFNQYGEGGYLAFALSAHGDHVFIFGDAALMGDDHLLQYGQVEGVNSNWYSILSNAGAGRTPTDLVVFDSGTPLANLLDASPRFQRVYADAHNEAWVPVSRPSVLAELPPPPRPDPGGPSACSEPAAHPAVSP